MTADVRMPVDSARCYVKAMLIVLIRGCSSCVMFSILIIVVSW